MIEVYRKLVGERIDLENPYDHIPILYEKYWRDQSEVESPKLHWTDQQTGTDEIWHDDGQQTAALRAFSDYKLWVVRKQTPEKALRLGIKTFVAKPKHEQSGDQGLASGLAVELRSLLVDALPLLLAAAVKEFSDFESEKAIETFTKMNILHFDDIWASYDFGGKAGEIGKGEPGDVALIRSDDEIELRFDGKREHIKDTLIECALSLSEAFTTKETGTGRQFSSLFNEALSACSRETNEARNRFLHKYGIAQKSVDTFKVNLESKLLKESEREDWCKQVKGILSVYGELNGDPEPGLVVDGRLFKTIKSGSATHAEIVEDLEKVEKLRPRVAIWEYNQKQLNKLLESSLDFAKLIALAAEKRKLPLIESSLDLLQNEARSTDEQALSYLGFDPEEVIRKKLGLDGSEGIPGAEALSFARGVFPLCDPVPNSSGIVLKIGNTKLAGEAYQTPPSQESYIEDAKSKAEHGAKAEQRVLLLACSKAELWQKNNPEQFKNAFLAIFEKENKIFSEERCVVAREFLQKDNLEGLLHVSKYVGDAGFDVFFPDEQNQQVRFVEVKRVQTKTNGRFFLSEPERKRALDYEARFPGHWRLWLVPGDENENQPIDATTTAIELFKRHKDRCDELIEGELTPEGWSFSY